MVICFRNTVTVRSVQARVRYVCCSTRPATEVRIFPTFCVSRSYIKTKKHSLKYVYTVMRVCLCIMIYVVQSSVMYAHPCLTGPYSHCMYCVRRLLYAYSTFLISGTACNPRKTYNDKKKVRQQHLSTK